MRGTIAPNARLTVTLEAGRWNLVMQALAELSARTIEEIQRQCMAQPPPRFEPPPPPPPDNGEQLRQMSAGQDHE